jgi:hypothetical protein
MVLNKLPNQRRYFYWLLTTWKVSSAHNPSSQVRMLSTSMSAKLLTHALSTPTLHPETISEALLLLSVSNPETSLKFLQGDGMKWRSDIEVRRIYIDLLHDAGRYVELRDFCDDEVEQGVDDWKVVKGWIDGHVGCLRTDASQSNIISTPNISDALKALLSKLENKYSLRNFALGTVYLSVKCYPDLTFEGLRPPRIQCSRYFGHYRRKNACFRDIQSYVAELPEEEQTKFLQDIALVSDDDEVCPFNFLHRHSSMRSTRRLMF